MALPIFIGIGFSWFMRVIGSYFIRKIMLIVVVQVGIFMATEGIIDAVKYLTEKTTDLIRGSDAFIMGSAFKIEDKLWRLYDYVYTMIDNLFAWFHLRINSVFDNFKLEELEQLLIIINFTAWLSALVAEIIAAAAESIRSGAALIAVPINALADTLHGLLLAIQTELNELELYFNDKILIFYTLITTTVGTAVDTFNVRLDGLFTAIAAAYDAFDHAISQIHTQVDQIEYTVNAHNQSIVIAKADLELWLFARFGFNTEFKPINSEAEAATFITELKNFTDMKFTKVSTSGFNIDWNQYRWVNPHQRADFLLEITVPPLDIDIDLQIEDLTTAISSAETLCTDILTMPDDIADKFKELFPTILQTTLETRIKGLLFIAAARAMVDKKNVVLEALDVKREEVTVEFDNKKIEVSEQVQALKEDIKQYQDNIIEKLPDTFKSPLERAFDQISEAIVESGNEAIVNIDQIIPDVDEIDHIVEIFDASIKANPDPNIKDSETFSIQDIYRILCDYFYRSERIALCVMLTTQDLKVTTEDLEEWLDKIRDETNP